MTPPQPLPVPLLGFIFTKALGERKGCLLTIRILRTNRKQYSIFLYFFLFQLNKPPPLHHSLTSREIKHTFSSWIAKGADGEQGHCPLWDASRCSAARASATWDRP